MLIKVYGLVLFLFVSSVGYSQPYVDLFNTKYQYFPWKEDANGQKSGATQIQSAFLLPVVKENKDVFLFGLSYSATTLKLNGSFDFSRKLTSHGMQVGYNKQWKNDKWKTLLLFIVRSNTPFSEILSVDFQYGGVLLFNYRQKENLRLRLGLYYNREYFGNFFVPLVGLEWKVNKSVNLFGDLPNSLNLEKRITDKFFLGLLFTSTTASYRIHNSALSEHYIREGKKSVGHNQLKLYLNYYFTRHLVVYTEAGRTYGRSYEYFIGEKGSAVSEEFYSKASDSFLFNAGFAFRFRRDQ